MDMQQAKDELTAIRKEYDDVKYRLENAGKRYQKAISTYLADKYSQPVTSLTSEELAEICEYLFNNETAHEMIKQWFENALQPLQQHQIGYRGKIYESPIYPVAQMRFSRQDESVADTVNALRVWAETVNEPEVAIDIFESSLSASGVYMAYYCHAEDRARLTVTTYGREKEIMTGPLSEVVAYVSVNHRYQHPAGYEWDDDYCEDDF